MDIAQYIIDMGSLQESQVCNKALRDLAERHGISVPLELETAQVRRLAFSRAPQPAYTCDTEDFLAMDQGQTRGRVSLDSYFRRDRLVPAARKCQSLPERSGSQFTLSSEGDHTVESTSPEKPFLLSQMADKEVRSLLSTMCTRFSKSSAMLQLAFAHGLSSDSKRMLNSAATLLS